MIYLFIFSESSDKLRGVDFDCIGLHNDSARKKRKKRFWSGNNSSPTIQNKVPIDAIIDNIEETSSKSIKPEIREKVKETGISTVSSSNMLIEGNVGNLLNKIRQDLLI